MEHWIVDWIFVQDWNGQMDGTGRESVLVFILGWAIVVHSFGPEHLPNPPVYINNSHSMLPPSPIPFLPVSYTFDLGQSLTI
jgi:hypothetical protein